MTFACQDPICNSGRNLLCRLRSSKIICGQIWKATDMDPNGRWQQQQRALMCVCVCMYPKTECVFLLCVRVHVPAHSVKGDPSSGSYYKPAGIHGQFRLMDEKKTQDGSYVNNRHSFCWHLPASNLQPLTPLAPFYTLYQADVTPAHICHSHDPSLSLGFVLFGF